MFALEKYLIPQIKYFILTVKHKYFVFRAGLKLNVSLWRLIKHDLSKFFPSELPYYGNQFYGLKNNPEGFIKAWIKHQNRNDHHWEYWIPRTGHNRCTPPYKDNEPVPMPYSAVKEMVADWLGASRAYEGKWSEMESWDWFNNNFDKVRVHPETKKYILKLLKNVK